MPITPDQDKDAFYKRIRGDPYVLKVLNLPDNNTAIAQHIVKRRENIDPLNSQSRYVFIFDVPSSSAMFPFEQSCMEIDVLCPAAYQFKADLVIEQIVALCGPLNECNWEVNGREVTRAVKVGNLAATPGFYRVGVRFYYYSSTPTRIKRI